MKSKNVVLGEKYSLTQQTTSFSFVFGANLLKIGCYKVYRWKLWFQIDFTNRKCFFNKAVFSTDQHWNRSSWINTNSLQYVSNLELHSSRMVLFVLYHDLEASSTSSTGFIMTKLCIWRAGASKSGFGLGNLTRCILDGRNELLEVSRWNISVCNISSSLPGVYI